ncbi:MAG: ABC transporter ATP-binding protein [Firmicutes bacterium]|nr:ABC transporter ATP-binding protein [Bacillota bacterium]
MLKVEKLVFEYRTPGRRVSALEGVGFTIPDGEAWAAIGPSGCGKSTLLYLMAGLLEPTSGRILFHGNRPGERAREIALILQSYGLFPWKTVRQNVMLGLQLRGIHGREGLARARRILAELDIADLEDAYPEELSGGQKQRVAIARSLVTEPSLLLMDEPFSALDALTRERMQNLLLDLWRQRRMTVLLVTHNIEEAVFLGRRVLVFSERPGRILEIVDNPGMGDPAYRASNQFYEKAVYIRQKLFSFTGVGAR